MKPLVFACCAVAASGAHAQSASYTIDPTHTFVVYEIQHFGTSTNRGRFDKKEGSVQLDRAAKTGHVEITIDTTSVNSGVGPLNARLQSKDFLNTAEFPNARFVGERVVFSGDKVAEVAGTLTLAGKTNPVTLKARNFNCYTSPLFKREVCGGDFEATIQRSLWGLNYGLAAVAPDDVHLLIQVEAIKQ